MMADQSMNLRNDPQNYHKTNTLSNPASTEMVMLSDDFSPSEWDVICQRGKDSFEHVGNQRFRRCIDDNIEMYMKATTRQEKSSIVTKIFDQVRLQDSKPYGGFVKKDLLTRRWFQVSEKEARDKVGQALRDAIKLIRGSASRKRAKVASTSNNTAPEASQISDRKRQRTYKVAAKKNDAFQTPNDSFASSLDAHYGRQTGNSVNTLSLLENQMNTLGTFPLSTPTPVDFDGSGFKTMLESAVEPIDATDNQSFNRKRRRSMDNALSLFGLNFGDRQEISSNPFLDEQMVSKRSWQPDFGNSDTPSTATASLGRNSDGLSTLRRLSLLGDHKLHQSNEGSDASASWQPMPLQFDAGATTFPGQHLFNLPSLGLTQCQTPNDLNALMAGTAGITRGGTDQCQASRFLHGWDLEPTPISSADKKVDHARSA